MRTNWKTLLAASALIAIIAWFVFPVGRTHDNKMKAPAPPQIPVALRWYRIGELSQTKIVTFRSRIGMGFFVEVASKRPQFMAAGGSLILHPGGIFVSDPRVAIVRMVSFP